MRPSRTHRHLTQMGQLLVTGVVMVASWCFGYAPMRTARVQHRQQLAEATTQLARVDDLVRPFGSEAAWSAAAQQRLAALQARFRRYDELPQLLEALVQTFKSSELRLVDVGQGNVEQAHVGDQPLVIDGEPSLRLPVTMVAEGRFRALLAVLDRLAADTFPGVVTLDHAEIQLKEKGTGVVTAQLQLELYVMGGRPDPPTVPTQPTAHEE